MAAFRAVMETEYDERREGKVRIGIIGAGAMGNVFAAHLAEAGEDVTLVDVARTIVDTVERDGLRIEDETGAMRTVRLKATTDPASVGLVDVALVLVKCYHTEAAVQGATPLIGSQTVVLSLQNGWGNAQRISAIVGQERVLAGVTYNSATVLGPGHVRHTGRGRTFIGELNGRQSDRLLRIAQAFNRAGLPTTASATVITEVWKKLAHNVCALPTSALLHVYANQLVEHDSTRALMQGLLRETVAVAKAQGIDLNELERWEAITRSLGGSSGSKASMLQDVEGRRRTEIDVINGAIVSAGRQAGIATPYNDAMVWLVKSLEGTFDA